MSKITKFSIAYVLAFFIFGLAFKPYPISAQDEITFDNGLRLIIEEDHRNPIVVFSTMIETGSSTEGAYLGSGISHLIEHMLFKGTEKYPVGSIESILHKYGGEMHAFTTHDYTGFRITILKEHSRIALDILKEMLTSPAFDEEELKKEKDVIEREMDMSKDDPGRRISKLAFSKSYLMHPYSIPVIGYKENLRRLKREDLLNFFKSKYAPEKTIIAIVGDIDRDAMFKDIDSLFQDIPRGGNTLTVLPQEPERLSETYYEEAMDINGAYLNLSFFSTELLNKDLYAMDLLSFILGQGQGSRLNEALRLKKQLVSSISCYNYTPRYKGLFIISAVMKEEDVEAVIDEIIGQLDSIKQHGITDKELLKAKNNFLAGYVYQKETIESRADDLALGALLAGTPQFFKSYIENVKSVTKDDIKMAAKKYLTKDNMTCVVLSKSGRALRKVSEPVMQSERGEVKKLALKNNLSVIISENQSLPIASISLLFKSGLRLESKETNGTSNLVSLMLLDGSRSMTRKEISEFYESKGMAVATYSENNSLGISVKCLKEHIEDGLRLISDICTDLVFPENELQRERLELIKAIDMQDNAIFSHGHRLLKNLLFKIHPYGFQKIGTYESINNIQRKELFSFYDNIFTTENMVLGISGEFNANEVQGLIEKYFSRLPSKKPGLVYPEKEPPLEDIRELSIKTDKAQSLVMLGFHGIDVFSKDRYTVEVMIDALSSASGILFKKIREESGLSYAQGAFHILGLDPGYIVIYTFTSAGSINNVREILSDEITSFIEMGVTEEELEKSKNHLKAMRQIEMQTNSDFIFTVCVDELYGLGYDNYKDYYKNIDNVTIEDIKRVAKNLLTLDRCAIVAMEGKE